MQKLIAKYGLAAHLAILAVAPLFLFPFVPETTIATVLLWLSVPVAVWTVMEPSLREGEMPHDARARVVWEMLSDPVLWLSLALVIYTGVRALNTGIGIGYDAEAAKWVVLKAKIPFAPGSVGGSGYLPFASTVAIAVLLQGARHSLGRSARMATLLTASSLAGAAALLSLVFLGEGNEVVRAAMSCCYPLCSFVGMAFALHFFGGLVALVSAFERGWNLAMPVFALAIGGTAAGAFVFSPASVSFAVGVCGVALAAYAFLYTCRNLHATGEFKFLVVCGLAMALGGLIAVAFMPGTLLTDRVAPYLTFDFRPERLREIRSMLTGVAVKSWLAHIWVGTGVGSFPLDFRFAATPEDWSLLATRQIPMYNGWCLLLAERGLVGAVAVLLPSGFLFFTYFRRLAGGLGRVALPHPATLLGPLSAVLLALTGAYDCSVLRADVLMVAAAFLAISASSFLRKKR